MISIITIFLNGDRFIAEAIESVLAQTHTEWELILVDDGSTDRAPAIAQSFAACFPEKIRYLEHSGHANRGMSASRNLGLQHARGDFISYLDADDVWRPAKLAEQLELLIKHPEAAYVYGPLELWHSWTGRPGDQDEVQELGLEPNRLVAPPDLLQLFLQNPRNNPSGILVRSKFLQEYGAYDEAFTGMYEDMVMHAKICLRHPVYASSKSWYRYRQHPHSCNAQAWRTGHDREARLTFFRWLENYLAQNGAAHSPVANVLRAELRALEGSARQRLRDTLWRQPSRARRLARRVVKRGRRILRAPPVILCYHRVLKPGADPFLLSVSPENFRQQLQVIRRIAHPLSLDELTNEARPPRGVVLTFDDGYLDNLENALPLLREFETPATIYIATGYVGSNREFWWDDLERLVLGPHTLPNVLRLQINGRSREWEVNEGEPFKSEWNVLREGEWSSRQKLFVDLHGALRPLAESLQQEVLGQLRALTGIPVSARPLFRCMNASELRSLAAEPLITLGAHTITHCDLDYRTQEEQAAEIDGSGQQLEGFLGREVEHFSYPYGSFNDATITACARGGLRSAVSCQEGAVARGVPLHCLPRFLVRDWDGREFVQELRRFFRG